MNIEKLWWGKNWSTILVSFIGVCALGFTIYCGIWSTNQAANNSKTLDNENKKLSSSIIDETILIRDQLQAAIALLDEIGKIRQAEIDAIQAASSAIAKLENIDRQDEATRKESNKIINAAKRTYTEGAGIILSSKALFAKIEKELDKIDLSTGAGAE